MADKSTRRMHVVTPDEEPKKANYKPDSFDVTTGNFAEGVDFIAKRVSARGKDFTKGTGAYLHGDDIIQFKKARKHEDRNSHLAFQRLTASSLATLASRSIWFYKPTADGPPRETRPPTDYMKAVLDLVDKPMPPVDQIVYAPVFTGDGECVRTPGYNQAGHVFMVLEARLSKGLAHFTPGKVTHRQAIEARQYLMRELLGDFPFVDASDKAAALASMIQPFVRPMFDGPSPYYGVDAPVERTGKGLLVKATQYPAVGLGQRGRLWKSGPSSTAEWSKVILAALRDGPTVVVLDNINDPVRSGAFAAMLTAWPTYSDRILQTTSNGTYPNNVMWVLTGNNFSASGENAKRGVPIRLNAHMERPDVGRDFRHPHLEQWAEAHRPRLVRAVLTIVAHWINEGRPEGSVRLGGFEGWAETMSGILEAVEVGGLLDNREAWLKTADDDTDKWTLFIELWSAGVDGADKSINREMTSSALAEMVAGVGIFDFGGRDPAMAMSSRLKEIVGSPKNGRTVARRTLNGVTLYRLGDAK